MRSLLMPKICKQIVSYFLLAIVVVMTFTGCKSGDDKTPVSNGAADDGGNNNQKTDDPVDVTNYSACNSGAITDLKASTWYRRTKLSADQDDFVDANLVFKDNTLEVRKTCTYQGKSAQLLVTVPITVSSKNVVITQGGQSSQDIQLGSQTITCSLKMNAGTMTYAFQGKCLRLSDSENTKVWSSLPQ